MCGRFVLGSDRKDIVSEFGINKDIPVFNSSYNITPGTFVPVIKDESGSTAVLAKWGLVPFWANDPQIGYKMINARAESVAEKPSFRKLFISQRCLVPANGFYEWKSVNAKTLFGDQGTPEKIPYYIHLKDKPLFSFAGLYNIWKDAEGMPVTTFTIITTRPNKLMESIHDRMPVIIDGADRNRWLDKGNTDTDKLLKLLVPYAGGKMEAYPVSKAVNSPENTSEKLIIKRDIGVV